MTYIKGARCIDGVVMMSDSRAVRGGDNSVEDKLFLALKDTIVGASGTTGTFYKFLRQVQGYIDRGEITTWDQFLDVVEDITKKLNERYYERTGDAIEVLIAMKPWKELAELHHVSARGATEEVRRVLAIGSGEPYGALLLKKMWNPEMTMKETAQLGTFIISAIDHFGLDNAVDSNPQVWYVPNKGDANKAPDTEIKEMKTLAQRSITVFEDKLRTLLSDSANIT